MKFKVGDKVFDHQPGFYEGPVGVITRIDVKYPRYPYVVYPSPSNEPRRQWCSRDEDLILFDDLTELERLYYGV